MEQIPNTAIIAIPLNEWTDVKVQLQNMAKNILDLKAKGQKEFLTIKEAMEVLKCSRNTLQSYIDKGFITPIQVKKEKYSKVLIKRSDIDYFIENNA